MSDKGPSTDSLIFRDKRKYGLRVRKAWYWVWWLLQKDEMKPHKLGILGEWVPVSILNAWGIKHASHFKYDTDKESDMIRDWETGAGVNPDIFVPPSLRIEVKNNGPRSFPSTQNDVIRHFLNEDPDHEGKWLLLCAHNRFNRKILNTYCVDTMEWGIQAVGFKTTAKACTSLWFPFSAYLKKMGYEGMWP